MGEDSQDYQEWSKARELVDSYDGYIIDLRRYGFTFITGLLVISGIFLPEGAQGAFSYGVKAGVIIVTLALIIAVALFEKNIFIMQKAVSQRALVLERRLNIEITEIISFQYWMNRGSWYKYFIYGLFIFGTCVLAYFLPIDPNPAWNWRIVALMFILSIILLGLISYDFRFRRPRDGEDWTIDRLEAEIGDKIGITLTNFSGKEIKFIRNSVIWSVEDEDTNMIRKTKDKRKFSHKAENTIRVQTGQSYTWFWDTGKDHVEKGLYLVTPRDEGYPINRRIRIREKAPEIRKR